MKYSIGNILKFTPEGWISFKRRSNLPEEVLENAVVKEIDDILIVVDENRLYR